MCFSKVKEMPPTCSCPSFERSSLILFISIHMGQRIEKKRDNKPVREDFQGFFPDYDCSLEVFLFGGEFYSVMH